jgi:hypothetical protein
MTLAAGTTLGPYRIVRLIGVGGMGEVYDSRSDPTRQASIGRTRTASAPKSWSWRRRASCGRISGRAIMCSTSTEFLARTTSPCCLLAILPKARRCNAISCSANCERGHTSRGPPTRLMPRFGSILIGSCRDTRQRHRRSYADARRQSLARFASRARPSDAVNPRRRTTLLTRRRRTTDQERRKPHNPRT